MKENIKAPRHWPLFGESTGTAAFPAERASNAENVSIWWRHHGLGDYLEDLWFDVSKLRYYRTNEDISVDPSTTILIIKM